MITDKDKITKTVKLNLIGIDGNCFVLMAAFQRQARREGWTKEEIDAVLDECKKSDYDHLLATLAGVCESPEDEDGGGDEDEN